VRADDPAYVSEQYATEDGLAARSSIYGGGPFDARDRVVDEIARLERPRVLEVGCGWGELAVRLTREAGATVVALDQSPRMVELARERGVDAVVGDVQSLEHADGSFDAVVVAWMLYHVPDLARALGEIVRVLRPGGSSWRRPTQPTTWSSCGRPSAATSPTGACRSAPRPARRLCGRPAPMCAARCSRGR
jgi:ubiquinone/menaquinone biosynthesis C-methylase UbiE